jgi:hypothetical protein
MSGDAMRWTLRDAILLAVIIAILAAWGLFVTIPAWAVTP